MKRSGRYQSLSTNGDSEERGREEEEEEEEEEGMTVEEVILEGRTLEGVTALPKHSIPSFATDATNPALMGTGGVPRGEVVDPPRGEMRFGCDCGLARAAFVIIAKTFRDDVLMRKSGSR